MCIVDELKAGIRASGKSLYRIAADAEIELSGLVRLMKGERDDVVTATAEKLARALDLEIIIRPRPGKGKGKGNGKRQ